MLGVKVDTSRAHLAEVSVNHTDERKLDLAEEFELKVNSRQLSAKHADRLGGRMVFYDCLAAGRTTNLLMENFGELCKHHVLSMTLHLTSVT